VKLIVGLGNPGRRYASNRHNVGFRVAARFARRHGIDLAEERFGGRFGRGCAGAPNGERLDVGVLQPHTYMNHSGEAVAAALGYLPVDDPSEDVVVVYDDVDLPFGRLRIRPSGGSAGHRGLESVIQCLGGDRFARLRFGVGRPEGAMETADYVLRNFSDEEEQQLETPMENAVKALDALLFEGLVAAMNRYNREAP